MAKESDVSDFDAAGGIAHLCFPHVQRIRMQDVGQSEAFVTKPFSATWFVLVIDGQYYVSDEMFFPFD